jgi:predicted secreted protein
MAKFNSSRFKILSGATAINDLEEVEMDVTSETVDVTTKDSSGWMEFLQTVKGFTMSGSGILDFAATEGVEEIYDDLVAGTAVTFKFSTSQTGDIEWSGSGILTNLNLGAPLNDKVSFSFSIQGTGALTKATIA